MEASDRGPRGERELDAIRAIARTRKTADLEALCEEMQVIAAESTRSERAAIYVLDPDEKQLTMVARPHGYDGELADRYRSRPMNVTILGDVVRNLTPKVFAASSLPEPYRTPTLADGFVEFAVVPLHADGVLTGTLNLARTRAEAYTDGDLRLALTLADQISVQLERTRMYMKEKERASKLARLNEELQRANEKLARTQRELLRKERLASVGELAVVVAHEVRNPLAVIFNVVSQLRRSPLPKSRDGSTLVEILEEEAVRLDRIVRALLDFGRPAPPQSRQLEVPVLVESAIELASRKIPGGEVRWLTALAPDAPCIEGDGHLLRQALVSVLMNAAEAQSYRGSVTVTSSRAMRAGREWVELSIADEGVTPDAAVLARAFDPFFTTKASGTGLGLAIVRRTVEEHGGEVSITASSEGGTVVTLLLPVQALDPTPPTAE